MVGREITQMFPKQTVPIGEVALSVRNLSLEGRFHDVSFDLRKGEILGLAGLVGSGRSNVAETMFGVTPATSGEIVVDGREIDIRNPGVAMDAGMAFLTEDRKESGCFLLLDVWRTCRSRCCASGHVRAGFVAEREIEALCNEQTASLRVRTPDLDEPVLNLSGGNQQKVLIARWLMTHPRILILDEPTRGIDVGAKAEIHRLISELAGQGRRGADDLVGDARGARHERSRAGHARRAHDRHPRSQGRNASQNHGARVAIARVLSEEEWNVAIQHASRRRADEAPTPGAAACRRNSAFSA